MDNCIKNTLEALENAKSYEDIAKALADYPYEQLINIWRNAIDGLEDQIWSHDFILIINYRYHKIDLQARKLQPNKTAYSVGLRYYFRIKRKGLKKLENLLDHVKENALVKDTSRGIWYKGWNNKGPLNERRCIRLLK